MSYFNILQLWFITFQTIYENYFRYVLIFVHYIVTFEGERSESCVAVPRVS